MVNDPVGDMLIQIKNASMAGRHEVSLPYSRMKHEVAKILVSEGYITEAGKIGEQPHAELHITLKYVGKTSVITDLKRKSKPGLRLYVDTQSIPQVVGGMGIAIVSTSQGIMTGKDAKHKGVGGELLCIIW